MVVVRWVSTLRSRFFELVDSDALRLFQAVVYLGIVASGVYMSWMGSPTTVANELGEAMNFVWVALTLFGPLLVALGWWMVRRGERLVLDRDSEGGGSHIYWGWYAQAGGDISIMMVCLAYVIAAFSASWAERGIFAAFVLSSLALCAAILVLRDVRRIRAIERL
jgi:hypothetical protein